MQSRRCKLTAFTVIGLLALVTSIVGYAEEKRYGPGVTDVEIKIGNTVPYSGPASGYGVYGIALAAYFKMINEQGGINGRKITLISLDNGYSPPKALEAPAPGNPAHGQPGECIDVDAQLLGLLIDADAELIALPGQMPAPEAWLLG